MQITNLVVARYLDGRTLKGTTHDFSANRVGFHVEVHGSSEVVELRCRQLKAVFFVNSLEGDPAREDVLGFVEGPAETAQGRKIAVRFRDGEFLCGYTLSWSPDREGFFLFPADSGSNNQRIYVIATNTDEIKAGPQAEALARRIIAEQQAREPRASSVSPAMPHPSGLIPRPSGLLPRPSGLMPRPSGGVHEAPPTRPSGTMPRGLNLPRRDKPDAA